MFVCVFNQIFSKLSGEIPIFARFKRDFDYKTANGWANILQWDDNNGRTGYLMEYIHDGSIDLSFTNERGDININGNSIANIVNNINSIKNGRTWQNVLSTQANGLHVMPTIADTVEMLLVYGYVYQIQNTATIPMDAFTIANSVVFFGDTEIAIVDNEHMRITNIKTDYLLRVFVR